MKTLSPLSIGIFLLVAISALPNFGFAAQYSEPFDVIDHEHALRPDQRRLFRQTLTEGLRGEHGHLFSVGRFPQAEVSDIYPVEHSFPAKSVFDAFRKKADDRRLIIVEHAFPGDVLRTGYTAAFHYRTNKNALDEHLIGYISAAMYGEHSHPQVYFHGWGSLKGAPGFETQLLSQKGASRNLKKGDVVSFRQLMNAVQADFRQFRV